MFLTRHPKTKPLWFSDRTQRRRSRCRAPPFLEGLQRPDDTKRMRSLLADWAKRERVHHARCRPSEKNMDREEPPGCHRSHGTWCTQGPLQAWCGKSCMRAPLVPRTSLNLGDHSEFRHGTGHTHRSLLHRASAPIECHEEPRRDASLNVGSRIRADESDLPRDRPLAPPIAAT